MPVCRICGCDDRNACAHPVLPGGACCWVRPDVCSMCVTLLAGLSMMGTISSEQMLEVLEGRMSINELRESREAELDTFRQKLDEQPLVTLATENDFRQLIRARSAGA